MLAVGLLGMSINRARDVTERKAPRMASRVRMNGYMGKVTRLKTLVMVWVYQARGMIRVSPFFVVRRRRCCRSSRRLELCLLALAEGLSFGSGRA